MSALVTVIMAVYDNEALVGRAIDSVFDQTMSDFELLIINDGSADDTAEAIDRSLRNRVPDDRARARVITHQQNQGYAAVTNTGMAQARGEWIIFVDSDDTVEPELLARLLDVGRAQQLQLVIPELRTIDEMTGRTGSLRRSEAANRVLSGTETLRLFAVGRLVDSQHVLIHRSAWDGVESPGGNTYGDVLFMTRIYANCRRVGFVHEPLYNYWIRPGSVTGSLRPTIWDLTRLSQWIDPLLDENFSEDEASTLKRYFRGQVLWQLVHKAAIEPRQNKLSREVTAWAHRRMTWADLAWFAFRREYSLVGVLALAKISPTLHRGLYKYYKARV